MVKHPSEYPWSSFQHNALGKKIEMITEHEQYNSLGANKTEREKAYLDLFKNEIATQDVDAIREATNKSWVLSSERFIKQIDAQINRQPLQKKEAETIVQISLKTIQPDPFGFLQ